MVTKWSVDSITIAYTCSKKIRSQPIQMPCSASLHFSYYHHPIKLYKLLNKSLYTQLPKSISSTSFSLYPNTQYNLHSRVQALDSLPLIFEKNFFTLSILLACATLFAVLNSHAGHCAWTVLRFLSNKLLRNINHLPDPTSLFPDLSPTRLSRLKREQCAQKRVWQPVSTAGSKLVLESRFSLAETSGDSAGSTKSASSANSGSPAPSEGFSCLLKGGDSSTES